MTALQIRHAILRVLVTVDPQALPLDAVLPEVNRQVRPSISLDDLKGHLSWLLDRAMVDFIPDPLDEKNADARRWLIREAGIATLKK